MRLIWRRKAVGDEGPVVVPPCQSCINSPPPVEDHSPKNAETLRSCTVMAMPPTICGLSDESSSPPPAVSGVSSMYSGSDWGIGGTGGSWVCLRAVFSGS